MDNVSSAQEQAIRHGIGKENYTWEELTLPAPMPVPDNIEDFKVDWQRQYDNAPSFYIDFKEALPKDFWDGFLFEEHKGFYFAERDGFVQWHFHSGNPEQQDGYGGRHFPLKMKDGTEKVLKGPWHGGLNSEAHGFTPAIEVHYTMPSSFGGRMGYFGLGVTMPLFAGLAAKFRPGMRFARVSEYGGTTFQPLAKQGVLKRELRIRAVADWKDPRYPEME